MQPANAWSNCAFETYKKLSECPTVSKNRACGKFMTSKASHIAKANIQDLKLLFSIA